jgi:hypothetical protein
VTNRCAGVYAFTRRARVRPKPRLYSEFLKSGCGVDAYKRRKRKDPSVSLRTRARRSSLRLPQRINIGFVQALNFAATEALLPDL